MKLFYIGRRVQRDKVFQAFKHGDDILLYKGVKYCRIGQAYAATKEGEVINIKRVPDSIEGETAPQDDIRRWEVEDALASAFIKRKADASKVEKNPQMKRIVSALEPVCEGLSYHQTKCLIEYLVDKAQAKGRRT